ncbi:MAG: hypothetical protein QGH39_05060, partial [Candidatus Thermoplasmatota archaeon]|nr:hypothetical protein [Candidatus Thermoplasmatota archaeon]
TDHTGDYRDLIVHFTKAVLSSYRDAVRRYLGKDLLSSDLDETSKRILIKAKKHNRWFNLNLVRTWFENISDYRLRTRLNLLIIRGALKDIGTTRDKKYRYADPLSDIVEKSDSRNELLRRIYFDNRLTDTL